MRVWVLLALAGCGGGWVDADTAAATNATRAQLMIETLCAPDSDACAPSQVRALERVSYCDNSSMLARHAQPVPEGGIQCQP